MNAAQGGLPSLGDGDADVMSISSEQVCCFAGTALSFWAATDRFFHPPAPSLASCLYVVQAGSHHGFAAPYRDLGKRLSRARCSVRAVVLSGTSLRTSSSLAPAVWKLPTPVCRCSDNAHSLTTQTYQRVFCSARFQRPWGRSHIVQNHHHSARPVERSPTSSLSTITHPQHGSAISVVVGAFIPADCHQKLLSSSVKTSTFFQQPQTQRSPTSSAGQRL